MSGFSLTLLNINLGFSSIFRLYTDITLVKKLTVPALSLFVRLLQCHNIVVGVRKHSEKSNVQKKMIKEEIRLDILCISLETTAE